jgi:predicted secreted Zn-dependent protease
MTQPGPAARNALAWRVARGCNGGECVRVAVNDGTVLIGDTKSPQGPVLSYTAAEWQAFVEGVQQGDFNDLV